MFYNVSRGGYDLPAVTFLNNWTGYTEAGLYMLAAVVMVTAAYFAVVELR